MENRSLGTIVVAGVIAVAMIATASLASSAASKPHAAPALAVVPQQPLPTTDVNGNGIPDWQESLAASGYQASSTAGYAAPPSLPPTEALARELFSDYAAAKQGGTLDMKAVNAAIGDSVVRHATDVPPAKAYAITDLSIGTNVSADAYQGALMTALSTMNSITEYELTTFSRATKDGNTADLAKLMTDADTYASTVQKLLVLKVAPAVADDHLATVNGLSALATATRNLGEWNGDPLTALVLVNAFAKADNEFSTSIASLMKLASASGKKS